MKLRAFEHIRPATTFALTAAVAVGSLIGLGTFAATAQTAPKQAHPNVAPPPWVNPDGSVNMSQATHIPIATNAPAWLKAEFPSGYVNLSQLRRPDAPGSPSHP